MVKFKGKNALGDMQAWLEKNLFKVVDKSLIIEKILVENFVEAIKEAVYDVHDPLYYDRRGFAGGLMDPKNVTLSVAQDSGQIRILVESITQGHDTLQGEYLSDTIIEGIESNWSNPYGVWSSPRDFVSLAKGKIEESPHELLSALRAAFEENGFKVKM